MTDWNDTVDADPVADMRKWQETIMLDTGLPPVTKFLMSPTVYGRLKDWMATQRSLKFVLEATPRRRFLKRYFIRRLLGEKPLAIVWPWASRKLYRFKMWRRMRNYDEE